jgi:hypothetical protein
MKTRCDPVTLRLPHSRATAITSVNSASIDDELLVILMKCQNFLIFLPTLAMLLGCRPHALDLQHNALSETEKKDGWRLLFDGKSFNGWRNYIGGGSPTNGWKIEEGCIRCTKNTGRPGSSGGDILTIEQFSDFDLSFEWRISNGGNSGLKYLVIDRQNAPGAILHRGDDGKSAVGLEYQILDDERHPDGRNGPVRQTGSLYLLVPPGSHRQLKPVGEFNQSRIVVRDKHVEHWLNGAKILEFELESPELMQAIAKSKFKDVPRFGAKFKSSILLQDHGDDVWFRNLKIRERMSGVNP